MANAKDMKEKPLKVLLWGPSGTGKTKLSGSFPNPHFIDLDNGMSTLAGSNINYITLSDKLTTDEDFIAICKANKKDPDKMCKSVGYVKTMFLLEHWANTLTSNDTVIVDSLTILNNGALDYVLKLAGVATARIQDYGAAQKLLEDVFEQINDVKCNVIVIAHQQFVKDDESGFISWLPDTIGKLANRIPIYFDEVWLTGTERSKEDKNKQDYYIETRPTRRTTAKSRLSLPAKIVDPTYEKVMKAKEQQKSKK
jgi:hypothetical protein